jgi:hypothetical protein
MWAIAVTGSTKMYMSIFLISLRYILLSCSIFYSVNSL